jgi:hypothetical protein
MLDGLRPETLLVSLPPFCTFPFLEPLLINLPALPPPFVEVALQVFAHKLGHGKPHLVKPKATNHGGQAKLKRMESRNSSSSARKVEMAGHYE